MAFQAVPVTQHLEVARSITRVLLPLLLRSETTPLSLQRYYLETPQGLADRISGNISNSATPQCRASNPKSASTFRAILPSRTLVTSTFLPLFSEIRRVAMRRCNPFASSLFMFPSSSNPISTLASSTNPRPQTICNFRSHNFTYSRTLFRGSLGKLGGTVSPNLLMQLEKTANRYPQSASAQASFLSALLRANMCDIIVQRCQSSKFASNSVCESIYMQALEKAGQTENFTAPTSGGGDSYQTASVNNRNLQAIGQAVASRVKGANISVSREGNGAKDSPLYVVVEEPRASLFFKWVKFIFWFALLTYMSLVALTVIIEAGGMLKKVSGAQNTEARAELQNTRFSDVHGCDEAKEELQEVVEFLKAPEKFNNLGGKLPKGLLLVGPPGTGKTLLARAVAGEAGVPFFYMSGSEFDEVYVGVGAKRVRELFASARNKSPAIIFIDELDAVGGKRNERDQAYSKQTLNQLLTELDGFDQSTGVVIIAATNFPEALDRALTRPGRFDRNVVVPLPDVRGRIAILKHHMRNIKFDASVDPTVLGRGTPGFSGAELENVVNQAAVRASKNKAVKVKMDDLEWAKDKILLGAERRSTVVQDKDKFMTAYHEGGHALVALFSPNCDPLYKVTVMPRGHALGITFQLPELDKVSTMKKEYMASIDVCMGGKVAEELVYGTDSATSGASSDIQKATKYAHAMVTKYGMSEELGNIDFNTNFKHWSPETRVKIDKEIKRILDESKARATKLLMERRKDLDILANALVKYETLNKDEVEKILKGETLTGKLSSLHSVAIKLPELSLPGGNSGVPRSGSEDENETRTGVPGKGSTSSF